MTDSTGKKLNYGEALVGSLSLSQWIRKRFRGDSLVGVMLPPSVAGALVNIALVFAEKIPVNLNFNAGPDAIASALRQCKIQKILTARTFMAKAKIEEIEGMVFLEDILRELRPLRKAFTLILAFLLPFRLLRRLYNRKLHAADIAAILFSSGSMTAPKGVMLSHHNILSNIEGIARLFRLDPDDRMMAVLPFFHALGFTFNLWFPLVSGLGVIYHPNPKDSATIGDMVRRFRATILISTPSFYELYIRECPAGELCSLRYALAGGEKLRAPVAATFKKKFGLELLEGYGCTELSPVVSVNIPNEPGDGRHAIGFKRGTVGRSIPGVAVKVVAPSSWEPLGSGREGLLLVRGPNQMVGYFGSPEKTRDVFHDGWYVTGDIASIDEDGFIRITGRFSRFSKIAGEMVPHTKVEEVIHAILGEAGCVVTGISDKQGRERLAAFYTAGRISADDLWESLCKTNIPRLWIPRRENLYRIKTLPVSGTGKVDLPKLRSMALE